MNYNVSYLSIELIKITLRDNNNNNGEIAIVGVRFSIHEWGSVKEE